MQKNQLIRLKAWFDGYTHAFLTGDTQTDSPLVLKIAHTARVCDNMGQLGRSVGLTDEQMCLAETVGLFHDLGRLEQYRRYRTFNEMISNCSSSAGCSICISPKHVGRPKREAIWPQSPVHCLTTASCAGLFTSSRNGWTKRNRQDRTRETVFPSLPSPVEKGVYFLISIGLTES